MLPAFVYTYDVAVKSPLPIDSAGTLPPIQASNWTNTNELFRVWSSVGSLKVYSSWFCCRYWQEKISQGRVDVIIVVVGNLPGAFSHNDASKTRAVCIKRCLHQTTGSGKTRNEQNANLAFIKRSCLVLSHCRHCCHSQERP